MLSWNNLSSQAAFIFCPLVLSWLYSYSHKGSYYFCLVFAAAAVVSLCLIMRMPNAMQFGKTAVKELPVVSEEAAKKGAAKSNDESVKASPQGPTEASKDSLQIDAVEAPTADEASVAVGSEGLESSANPVSPLSPANPMDSGVAVEVEMATVEERMKGTELTSQEA